MNKHSEDQFSVCTPEEESFFQEMDAKKVRAQEVAWHSLLSEERAIDAMMEATFVYGKGPLLYGQDVAIRMIYQAIKDDKVPGVVLEDSYGN